MTKLNKYDRRHKQELKWERELDEIRDKKRNPKYKSLVEPYQIGWKVYIDLRNDIARREDAGFLRGLIRKGYKDFKSVRHVERIRDIRRGEKGYFMWGDRRWHWVSYYPDRKRFSEKQYNKMSERQQKYFEWNNDIYNHRWVKGWYTLSLPDYYLVLKSKPHIVTHAVIHDPMLDSRETELKEYLEPYFRKGYNYRTYRKKWDSKRRAKGIIETNKLIEEGLELIRV